MQNPDPVRPPEAARTMTRTMTRTMSHTIRRRLSSARSILGPSESNSPANLGRETVLRYREKLQPIFPTEFFDSVKNTPGEPDKAAVHKTQFILQHTLSVPMATVANLHVQPGDENFTMWLFISAYFPVIAACMAPLGNLISLVGLLEHWQVDPQSMRMLADAHPVFVLNVLSFTLGIVGNASLLMNFSGSLRYLVAQCVSIFCFVVAAVCLLIAVLLADRRIRKDGLEASEGFWLAVFTIGIYAWCSSVLVVNVVGYKMDKYRARFNLDKKQRSLMSHTIAFSVWQAVGTVVMAKLIPDIAYGTSLYYCTVSMLTIGLGDIVPTTPGAKVFALFFSLVGVLIMGLIIAVLRQVILYSAGPSLFWHHLERKRQKLLEEIQDDPSIEQSTPGAFEAMRSIRKRVTYSQEHRSLAVTLVVFISFWLLGALVFYGTEGWSYFNAMYFCFLCLVTIGYGDFHPATSLGRVFFVVWAIAAVPLMTILISNLGDTLFDISDRFDSVARRMLNPDTYNMIFGAKKHFPARKKDGSSKPQSALETAKTQISSDDSATTDDVPTMDPRYIAQMDLTLGIVDSLAVLKQILADAMDSPDKEYDFDEWTEHMRHLESTDAESEGFWTGEFSPLSLPLRESNYLLIKSLQKIDRDLSRLMAVQNKAFCGDTSAEGRSDGTDQGSDESSSRSGTGENESTTGDKPSMEVAFDDYVM